MKLNFLNVLNRKASPEEIAEQIVALEVKLKQCEEDRDRAKAGCKEIRGRMMCGEKIPPDVIRNVDRTYEDAVLNLEIVNDGLKELNQVLYDLLEAHRGDEDGKIAELDRKRQEEYQRMECELAKLKGRLVGLAVAIYGDPGVAQGMLGNLQQFSFNQDNPNYDVFITERNRVMSELKHPTATELKDECDAKRMGLMSFRVEDECVRLIEQYRFRQRTELAAAGV